MRPLFTKYCAALTKISDCNFVSGVDLKMLLLQFSAHWFSTHFGLWGIKCRNFTWNNFMFVLVQMIYNRFKSFEWIPYHWLSCRTTLHTLWKIAIYLTYSWVHGQQLFHFLVEHGIVNFSSYQVIFQCHPKLGRPSTLEGAKSLNIIFNNHWELLR